MLSAEAAEALGGFDEVLGDKGFDSDAIRGTKYDGLLGNFAYDETGVGIFETSIGVIKGGKLVAAES